MNVVLYLRYSSDKQNEQSIEGQRRICEAYCKQNKMNIINSYIDRALSATKNIEKRESFQQMIKDSKKRNFQAIIVYKLDRFARNRYDSATYKAKLKENGVKVISATEPISDSPEGVLLESVLEGMAEFYSKELAQKVTRGMRETAMKGNSCGGTPALGYKIVNKKYVIDPLTGPIVKEIFKRYTEGDSLANIAEDLNNRNIKTVRGNCFNKNSFHSILKNEKYIGIMKFQNLKITDAVPALVDKNTFDAAQFRLQQNEKAPGKGKASVEYLLTQKIFCGHCNLQMTGDSGTGKNNQKYYYYSCAGKKHLKSCDKKSIKKEPLEKAIVEDLLEYLTKEKIETIARIAVKQAELENDKNNNYKAIEKELKTNEKNILNLLKLVENGSYSEALLKRLNELEDQKKQLQINLTQEEEKLVKLDEKIIIHWLTSSIEKYKGKENFQKFLINMLVNSITIYDEPDGTFKIVAAYNLSPGNTSIFRVSNFDKEGPPTVDKSEKLIIFQNFIINITKHRIG